MLKPRILLFLSLSLWAPAGWSQSAEPPEWLDQPYPYLVVDQRLDDVFKDLGRNVGVDVVVSAKVDGQVQRYRSEGPVAELLADLAGQHGLDWFFDGHQLHVTSRAEMVARTWNVKPDAERDVKAALAAVGIGAARSPIAFSEERGEVVVSGPPRYVALAEDIVRRFRPRPAAAAPVVNVIYGRAPSQGAS
ncbi:MAG: hypothetical protein ACR2Q4_10700 [Geminicoccaceae bacterium]